MENGTGHCDEGRRILVIEDDWLAYLREVFGFNVQVLSSGREYLDVHELERAAKSLQESPNAHVVQPSAKHVMEKSWWQLKRKPWEVRKRKKKRDLKEKKAKRKRSRKK